MEKLFEGKRIIDLEVYEDMQTIERKEFEKVLISGKLIRTVEIDGEQYVEISSESSEKSFFVSSEVDKKAAESLEERIDLIKKKIEKGNITLTLVDAAIEFGALIESRLISSERVKADLAKIATNLNRADFSTFIFTLYLYVMSQGIKISQYKIDFEEYLSPGTIYQKTIEHLQAINDMNPQEQEESGEAREDIKKIRRATKQKWLERIESNGGISSYINRGISGNERELIVDSLLEKLAEEHVYERYEYVKLLNKIKLDDAYLAKILELRLFSDEHIIVFYSTPWLGNKIESAMNRLKPHVRKELEERLEGSINEWINFVVEKIRNESIQPDQKNEMIEYLPPSIKKRVLARIEEMQETTKTDGKEAEQPALQEEPLETLLRNILATKGKEQEEYIKSFKERKSKIEDLVNLVEAKELSYEDIARLYEVNELSRTIRKVVARLDLKSAIRVFMTSGKISILNSLDWDNVNADKLRTISLTEPDIKASAIARIIVKMHQLGKLEMTDLEISGIFAYKINDNDALRAYFELVKNGLYNEDVIIALWDESVNNSNMENPYEQPSSENVTIEELLDFFNTDKVIEKMQGYCNPNLPDEESKKENEGKTEDLTYDVGSNEFLTFYRGILEANKIANQEETQQIIAELEAKLSGKILEGLEKRETTYLVVAIELLDKNVISTENMQEILSEENQEKLVEMHGQELDDKTLLSLFKHGLVREYILEVLYQDMDKQELTEKTQNNKMSTEDIAILCALGILGREQIKGIKFETIDWKNLSMLLDETKLKNLIELLYLNQNIGFEEIKKLKEMGILSAKEAEVLTNQIDLEEILKKGLTSEEGVGVKGKTKVKEGSKKREENGLPDREVLLGDLGFKPITDERGNVLVVAEGSFKGYKIYMDKTGQYKVIILEKDMHASTFVMHTAKAGEFFREEAERTSLVGSRSDWREKSRTDGSVTARLHTVNWGRNIIETIVDIDSTFKFDDEEERGKYVKAQTEKLCKENEESLEYLRMVKEEVYE